MASLADPNAERPNGGPGLTQAEVKRLTSYKQRYTLQHCALNHHADLDLRDEDRLLFAKWLYGRGKLHG